MSAKLKRIREALILIAAPATRQIEILAKLGHFQGGDNDTAEVDGQWNVDEIGLQFEDAEIFVPSLVKQKEIDVSQADCIFDLKTKLSRHSGIENLRFWTVDAIRTDPEWENIREAAQKCLKKLGPFAEF